MRPVNDRLRQELGILFDTSSRSPDWRPTLFHLSREDDRRSLHELLASGAIRRVHDTLDRQLRQLMAARDPGMPPAGDEVARRVRQHLAGRDRTEYGVFVWYPWSGLLVRALPAEEYRELRTDRNRYKITSEEQRRLAGKRVGVVGLSVGNAAAVTLALEGVGGSYKIADFDTLDLTNLNRIRAGLPDLGLDKTVLAARQMFEVDPYLHIERYSAGIHSGNVDDFLLAGGKLDVVIEECDDLYVKVAVRERARAHGIPVLMNTSDRGLLDVERFDLEPDRPVFHGLVGDVRAEELKGLAAKDKLPFVLAVFGERLLSPRMLASLPEVGKTISSWPQLASAVSLGAGIVADAARRLLLGEPLTSGRYRLDPDMLVTGEFRMHGDPVPQG
ncbi:ThiF family adenylyltransferase [Microbispora sp. NEAU-D428]|uniref:ThiF family adenylyltransferase n=1 Tax=Microbispora sitophila TaxID=2771537 RepID=UPI0018665996|nr:ThiF family adenylyltransferase [Microbispora sitophila]MBE3016162.1 ThiF family adenylyltransferase [Microbispora sitophila]